MYEFLEWKNININIPESEIIAKYESDIFYVCPIFYFRQIDRQFRWILAPWVSNVVISPKGGYIVRGGVI